MCAVRAAHACCGQAVCRGCAARAHSRVCVRLNAGPSCARARAGALCAALETTAHWRTTRLRRACTQRRYARGAPQRQHMRVRTPSQQHVHPPAASSPLPRSVCRHIVACTLAPRSSGPQFAAMAGTATARRAGGGGGGWATRRGGMRACAWHGGRARNACSRQLTERNGIPRARLALM